MKNLLKILIGGLVIVAICFGLAKLRVKREAEPEPEVIRPVRTMQLASSAQNFSKNYFGTVQGGKRVDLSFRVSGPLNKILADKGAAVKKGDLLAVLDKRDFNTNLKQAQSAQAQAQAQYKDAQTNFNRYENLYKQRAISKSQYDAAKTQLDVTRSAVNTAAARTAQARDALNDTELRAPFDGIIADRMAENFQDITAKQAIFSLQDISTLEIVFNIPDNDILLAPLPRDASLAKLTQLDGSKEIFTLTARFDAIPDKTFKLKLKEFAAQADARTNTYPVTAVMPKQPDIKFLPGMAVEVNVNFINSDNGNNNYIIPASAVLTADNNYYVWRYENGEVKRVMINIIEPVNGGMFEISSRNLNDLNDGDIIVTAGVNFLRDGQQVRLSLSSEERAN